MDRSLKAFSRIWLFVKRRLGTWSFSHVFSRIATIFKRYGWTSRRFARRLDRFVELLKKYDINPTFPVTASVVDRHPSLFRSLQERGVEFAIHGYYHIDYTQIEEKEVMEHLLRAKEIFKRHGITCSGFRFPYLRRNSTVIRMLGESGMEWDSSEVISWDLLSPSGFDNKYWVSYQRILDTYEPAQAKESPALPVYREGLLELPVSVPDDDILVERLGLKDGKKISDIWIEMLYHIRKREELLVLQVHPERFECFENALETMLQKAISLEDVWIAPLGEITRWWKERHSKPGRSRKESHSTIRRSFSTDFEPDRSQNISAGRWPNGMKCALSVTGDIDGIDLRDFWERIHGI